MEDLEIEVSFYVHATEDEGKVLGAVTQVLGVRAEEVEGMRASGHHGNPIVIFRGKLKGQRAEEVLRSLACKLRRADKSALISRAEDLVDESGKVHLRLDKQEMVMGRAAIGSDDPVKLLISARNRRGLLERVMAELRGTGHEGEG